MDTEPAQAELTDEEKKLDFRPNTIPDITSYVLNTSFVKFTVPEASEGFSSIANEWTKKQDDAVKFVKAWVLERKQTTRIEDIAPGVYFSTQWRKWQAAFKQWQDKQLSHKTAVQKKAAAKAAKAAAKLVAARAAEAKAKKEAELKEKKKAEEKAKKEAEKKEGEEAAEEADEEEAKEEPAAAVEEEPEEPEVPAVDMETVDAFGVADIMDMGNETPLFKEFTTEDWVLTALAFELHLLCHAFKADAKDEERGGMHLDHIPFYYNKYFKKTLNLKSYGVEKIEDLIELVKESVYCKGKVLESALSEEMENFQIFAQLAEEKRKHRHIMIDAGEESFKLKFSLHEFTPQSSSKGFGKGSPMGGMGAKGAPKGASKGLPTPGAGLPKGAGKVMVGSGLPKGAGKVGAPSWPAVTPMGVRPTIMKGKGGKGFLGKGIGK